MSGSAKQAAVCGHFILKTNLDRLMEICNDDVADKGEEGYDPIDRKDQTGEIQCTDREISKIEMVPPRRSSTCRMNYA